MIESSAGAASLVVPAAQDARRSFFTWMGGVLLVIVLVGFAPTLYFRSSSIHQKCRRISTRRRRLDDVVRSLALTTAADRQRSTNMAPTRGLAWSFGRCSSRRSQRIHRFPLREPTGGTDRYRSSATFHHDTAAQVSTAVLGFAGQILVFAALVTLAVLLRNSSASHKRLMLTASIGIVGAAAARWGYVLVAIGVAPQMAFPIAGIVGTLGVPGPSSLRSSYMTNVRWDACCR